MKESWNAVKCSNLFTKVQEKIYIFPGPVQFIKLDKLPKKAEFKRKQTGQ